MSKQLCSMLAGAGMLCLSQAAVAQGPVFAWAASASHTSEATEVYGVAADAWGNVYATGSFYEGVDFDPGPGSVPLTPMGESDVFVVKYNPAGGLVWAKRVGGYGADYANCISVDTAGGIYIGGEFQDVVDFNPGAGTHDLASEGEWDAFVLHLDSAGNFGWAKRFGGAGTGNGEGSSIRGIFTGRHGQVYVTGKINGTAVFAPGITLNGTGETDIFAARLSSAGDVIWAAGMYGDSYGYGQSVCADDAGNVYLAGAFAGQADFNPSASASNLLTAAGSSYVIFIARLDSAGNYAWAKRIGGTLLDIGRSVRTDGTHVYTTGYFTGSVLFDPAGTPASVLNATSQDVFVSKLDTAGNYIWGRAMGGNGADLSYALSLDKAGNIYTAGYFNGTADFDPGAASAPLSTKGGTDAFVSKLSPDGDYLWAGQMGGTDNENVYAMYCDAHGHVYTGGYFNGTADFDPGTGTSTLLSEGGQGAFVQKLFCADTTRMELRELSCTGSYTFNGQTFTTSGVYTIHLTARSGCDSTIVLGLTVSDIRAELTVNGSDLSTRESYSSYQWYRDGSRIDGATNRVHTVTENGDYRVVVTNGDGCTDTSDVHSVRNLSVSPEAGAPPRVSIYPNPVRDQLLIHAPVPVSASVLTITGKPVIKTGTGSLVQVGELPPGIYLLQLADPEGRLLTTLRFTKQ